MYTLGTDPPIANKIKGSKGPSPSFTAHPTILYLPGALIVKPILHKLILLDLSLFSRKKDFTFGATVSLLFGGVEQIRLSIPFEVSV